jgi:hypothetical protein
MKISYIEGLISFLVDKLSDSVYISNRILDWQHVAMIFPNL